MIEKIKLELTNLWLTKKTYLITAVVALIVGVVAFVFKRKKTKSTTRKRR